MHKHAVEGHDLLAALAVVVDPLRCCGGSGDDAVHVAPDVPGDDPRGVVGLNRRQVANLDQDGEGGGGGGK